MGSLRTSQKRSQSVSVQNTLEEELIRRHSQVLADQIDFEIMYELFEWTRLERSPWVTEQEFLDFKNWLKELCMGKYAGKQGVWFFELEEDATAFALKWC